MSENQEHNPLVSIIVRTKDRPKLLRRALQSIAAQTYRPIEVVLVNDGGCELEVNGLQEILGEVGLRYVLNAKCLGPAEAANQGLRHASGAYIGFLDDDDEYLPDHLTRLVECLRDNGTNACYSDCEVRVAEYDEGTGDLRIVSRELYPSYDFSPTLLLFFNYIPLITILIEKSSLDKVGFFDRDFEIYEDWDFFIRMSRVCSVSHCPSVSAIYNKWDRGNQLTGLSMTKSAHKDRRFYSLIVEKHKSLYTPAALYSFYELKNHLDLRLADAFRAVERLEMSIKQLSARNAEEREQLLNEREKLLSDREHMKGLLAEQTRMSQSLSEQNVALASRLNRILSSRGWKLLSKYYCIKEFFIGNDSMPNLIWRTEQRLRRSAKKFLPKRLQLSLKILHYHLLKPLNSKKVGSFREGRKPFITIVVPVFNHAEYLTQALKSALSQDYEYYEVVAVDDCSTDLRVRDILIGFSGAERLKILYNDKNMGISETLNKAIMHARGDFIAFLDCDDFLPTDALKRVAERIAGDGVSGYFFSDRINVDKNGNEIERVTFINRKRDDYLRELLRGMFTDHLKVIKREAFLEVGLHEPKFDSAQDYDLALRYAFRHPQGFHYINSYLYFHRVYPDQISSKNLNSQMELAFRAKDQILKKMRLKSGRHRSSVSLVLLSFNKKEHTKRCVEAIKQTVTGLYEIILFDNGSNKDTVDYLEREFSRDPKIKLYFSEVNLGCPKGRKEAISRSDGDYVITLDNDIVVQNEWFEELILRVDEDSGIAGACCKVIFPDGKIQYNGGRAQISDGFIEFSLIDGWKSCDDLSTMVKHDCDWIPGGATIYKREIYERVALCDEFENAFEDNDFSLNVKELGYRLVNCPTARVIHNHVMYDRKSMRQEKEYMDSRYDKEALKRSVQAFYRRHGLIIKDEYVFRVFGFNNMSDSEIKSYFEDSVRVPA